MAVSTPIRSAEYNERPRYEVAENLAGEVASSQLRATSETTSRGKSNNKKGKKKFQKQKKLVDIYHKNQEVVFSAALK